MNAKTVKTFLIVITLLLQMSTTFAREGTGSSGGGNENEGDFVSLARIIYQHLETNAAKSSDHLGFNISDYKQAINQTEVHCTVDKKLLTLMRELRKTAYYTSAPERINLDCSNYELAKKSGELGPITIFHEYMRVIGKDTSAYETSSKLLLVVNDIGVLKSKLLIDAGITKCHNEFKFTSLPQTASASMQDAFQIEIGRAITSCLYNAGLSEKVNPSTPSSQIITRFANLIGANLETFNSVVTSQLKRP